MVPEEAKLLSGACASIDTIPRHTPSKSYMAVQMANAQRSLDDRRPMPVDAEYLTGSSKTRMEVP